jgi:hypothetical protein
VSRPRRCWLQRGISGRWPSTSRRMEHQSRFRLLSRSTKRVVKFYNGRGTAEQHIKEGKNALRWTRLSCQAFRHDAVRLQLHTLAYNLAKLPAHAGPAAGSRAVVADHAARSWSRSAPGSCATAATSCSSWPRWRCRERCSPRSCAGSTGSGRGHSSHDRVALDTGD